MHIIVWRSRKAVIKFMRRWLNAAEQKLVGYLLIRPLGILDSVIGLNFGFGLAEAPNKAWRSLIEVYFVFGFVLWYGLYMLNDLNDLNEDMKHPEKSRRPLVSGRLTKRDAIIIIVVHLTLALLWSYKISRVLFILISLTIIQQHIYCVKPIRLKRFPLLGVLFAGPIGWVIRFLVGWTLVQPLNEVPWIFCVFLLLFTYGGYLYRRIDYQAQTGSPFPFLSVQRMNILIAGFSTSAIILFVYMVFSRLLSWFSIILVFIYGTILLLSFFTLRKTVGLRRFEDTVVVTTLIISFLFLVRR